jgi:predicted Zn-dependent protease
MKNRPVQVVALLLTALFTIPTPQLIAAAQEPAANATQEKPKQESSEEKKLRQEEENRKKKEEKRQKEEEKARVVAIKNYKTLTEFAEDLYAGDRDFREQVDDGYSDLQAAHAEQAYRINISRRQEVLLTENEGEMLTLRRALYDNPRVQEYVNRLGQQIVPDDSDKLYAFKVVVNPIPYAYTLSTGTILVSTGMISLLENEAQLTYVLAHELAHVYKDHWRIKVMMPIAEAEYNRKQAMKQMFWATVLSLTAAGVGSAVAGKEGAAVGAVSGFVAGRAIGNYYAGKIGLDWNIAQENEADDFALKAILQKSFDIKEVPRLYAIMAQVSSKDMRTQLGFLGARSRIRERTEYAQKLIDGSLQPQYQEALKANRIKGTGPEFNVIMAELKRDNGIEAFYRDMFQLARMNLQESVMLRSDDPLAAYYYGRVMKQIGRTKEELDLAQQSLLKAISLDTRHEIPEVQLHRALLLMDSKDNSTNPEAIAALKSYITAYGQKRATSIRNDRLVPPNLDILYGYMRLLGDKTWTVPDVVETLRASSGNPSSPAASTPSSIPRIEPASQTLSPTSPKKTRKPGQ